MLRAVDRLLSLLIVWALLFCYLGCQTLKQSPEDRLLQSAFTALKNASWDEYQRLIVLPSDFDLKSQGLGSPFKQSLSFSAVLKKEEAERHQKLFNQVIAGGESFVDFSTGKFVSAGKLSFSGAYELPSGDTIDVRIFSLKVEDKSGVVRDDLAPSFMITLWGEQLRIVDLVVSTPEE